MDTGQIASDGSMAAIVRQLQATTDMQVAMMKQIAESQQQIAVMITAAGVGENVNVMA